jgi:hypothetical protein
MGRCRHSECGKHGIRAGECLSDGRAIAERLDNCNARSARHVGYAFRPGTYDGRESRPCCSADTEYSLAETTRGADDGHMIGKPPT